MFADSRIDIFSPPLSSQTDVTPAPSPKLYPGVLSNTDFLSKNTVGSFTQANSISQLTQSEASSVKPEIKSYKDFGSILSRTLAPDAQGNIHEEQMQNAITYFLLNSKDTKLGVAYLEAFNKYIGSGNPPMSAEDTVKASLKDMVKEGILKKEDAEKINGISFRAAQLDNNTNELFDGKGSNNDPTVAIMPMEQAITKAQNMLEAIDGGKELVASRSLDAPSNQKPIASTDSGSLSSSEGLNSSSGSGGSGGFLWKPVSESDGKLVVLVPSTLAGNVASCEIHSTIPSTNSTLIERGKYVGNVNRGRPTFRFSRPGAGFPNNCYVVATLKDGSTKTFSVPNGASRVEEG